MFVSPHRLAHPFFLFFQNKRSCEPLIFKILVGFCSAMDPMPHNQTQRHVIFPAIPIDETTFETYSGTVSFSGVVDYLLIDIQPRQLFSGKAHFVLPCTFLTSVFFLY
jgi:hypothetical protein